MKTPEDRARRLLETVRCEEKTASLRIWTCSSVLSFLISKGVFNLP